MFSGSSKSFRPISAGSSRCGSPKTKAFGRSRRIWDAAKAPSNSFNSVECRTCGSEWVSRMAERDLIEQLDQAVEAILSGAQTAPPAEKAVAELISIARELWRLPNNDFRA